MSTNLTRTSAQQAVVNQLVDKFGIDGSKVLFLNERDRNEPWLRARLLASIARQSGLFKVVRAEYENYIEPLNQIVYQATIVDLQDRIYSLPGVASANEKISNSEEASKSAAGDEPINAHDLAESRSLKSTLELAGFDPFDPTSVVPLGEFNPPTRDEAAAKAQSRLNDLARIHILAKEKFLIIEGAGPDGKDDTTGYRNFLETHYSGVRTAVGFDALQRKSLIEALERYEIDEFAGLNVSAESEAN
jgi:hypothetical protein